MIEEDWELKGTKWKLAGYVDVETGKLTVAEPENCESCYTLAFDPIVRHGVYL